VSPIVHEMNTTNKCAPLVGGIWVGYASINHVPSCFCRAVQCTAKKVSHHLNVSVIKALITHLNFDVTEKWWLVFIAGHCTLCVPITFLYLCLFQLTINFFLTIFLNPFNQRLWRCLSHSIVSDLQP
jgi:hypothetical protein